jgi:hypothetical protein
MVPEKCRQHTKIVTIEDLIDAVTTWPVASPCGSGQKYKRCCSGKLL